MESDGISGTGKVTHFKLNGQGAQQNVQFQFHIQTELHSATLSLKGVSIINEIVHRITFSSNERVIYNFNFVKID